MIVSPKQHLHPSQKGLRSQMDFALYPNLTIAATIYCSIKDWEMRGQTPHPRAILKE